MHWTSSFPSALIAALLFPAALAAQNTAFELRLPTANDAIFQGAGSDFYQFVDRTFEGKKSTPWEGGQFGYVRDPKRVGSSIVHTRFHEGLDIKPVRRDAAGEPLDDVMAISPGRVVHVSTTSSHSNYGRYIVVQHDWGQGPFFSLYAHLNTTAVKPGDSVQAGQILGRLGYTGSGIDKRRAHLHVELNLFWSSQFQRWHELSFTSPNHHGVYNGLNLIGLDLAGLYLARQKNLRLTPADFVRQTPPYFEVAVPGSAEMEMVKLYPWLLNGPAPAATPPSWRVTFSAWGLPVSVRPGTTSVSAPQLSGIPPKESIPHSLNTRGLITGSGENAQLSAGGLSFIRLACGLP